MNAFLTAPMLGALLAAGHEPVLHEGAAAPREARPAPTLQQQDFSNWQVWWRFHGARVLDLRARIRARNPDLVPDRAQVTEQALPVLQKILAEESDPDLLSCAAIALGKSARQLDEAGALVAALRNLLAHEHGDVASSATLALGLTSSLEALAPLTSLAEDDPDGRALVNRAEVPLVLRARAFYALAVLADRLAVPQAEGAVLDAARAVCGNLVPTVSTIPDVPVAAIYALSVLGKAGDRDLAEAHIKEALELLDGLRNTLRSPVRDHVPVAVGKLLRRSHERGLPKAELQLRVRLASWRSQLDDLLADPPPYLKELVERPAGPTGGPSGPPRLVENEIPDVRALILAVGMTAGLPGATGSPDEWTPILIRTSEAPIERLTRHLALMALAEIGDTKGIDHLVEQVRSSNDPAIRSWSALGLAVHASTHELSADRCRAMVEPLTARLESEHLAWHRAPVALALGFLDHPDSVSALRAVLEGDVHHDELVGMTSLALAIQGDTESLPTIREFFRASSRRPERAELTGLAATLLGDRTWSDSEVARLDGKNLVSVAVHANLYGASGDGTYLPRLLRVAGAPRAKSLSRSFACVAIGSLCDPAPNHWNRAIADHVAYRSAPPTLTDSVHGVLDLL